MSPPTTQSQPTTNSQPEGRKQIIATTRGTGALPSAGPVLTVIRCTLILPGAMAFFFSAQYCLAVMSELIDTSGLPYLALWVAMNWLSGILFIYAGVKIAPGIKVLVTVALTTAIMVWHSSIFNSVATSSVASDMTVTAAAISAVGGMLVALIFGGYEVAKTWPKDNFSLAAYDAIKRPRETAGSVR